MRNFIPMRQIFGKLLIGSLFLGGCQESVSIQDFTSPDQQWGVLYQDLQNSGLYPDPRVFLRAMPNGAPGEILSIYEKEKANPGFSLTQFVQTHFTAPSFPTPSPWKPGDSLANYLPGFFRQLETAPRTDRTGALITLRKKYVGYAEELKYQDTPFLQAAFWKMGQDSLAEFTAVNVAQLIHDFGYVPVVNRPYGLERTSLPYFAGLVETVAEKKKDPQVYLIALPQLQKEYQRWMAIHEANLAKEQNQARQDQKPAFQTLVFLGKDQSLNRFYSEYAKPRPEFFAADLAKAQGSAPVWKQIAAAEQSGWVDTDRWLRQGSWATTQAIPVDLNACLYQLELVLAKAYDVADQPTYAQSMRNLAEARKALMQKTLWNPAAGQYQDYFWDTKSFSQHTSLASGYALWAGIATPEQAKKMAQQWPQLRIDFPMQPANLRLITQAAWITIQGFRRYGLTEEASRWSDQVRRLIEQSWPDLPLEDQVAVGAVYIALRP